MLDAADLGQAIAAHPGNVEAALTAYEEIMFPRAETEAIAARETVELIFGAGAPYALANLLNGGEEPKAA
jgi:delta 1-pyrroline-5-carboxylate dehydrogenase